MEHVVVDDLDNSLQPAAVMRHLTEPLGCEDLAINYYELAPGDSFAFAYHNHEVQEEVFVVLSGTATWVVGPEPADSDDPTAADPGDPRERREVEVGPMEAIRVPPGQFQRGWNRRPSETDGDGNGDGGGPAKAERVTALALGAPLAYGEQLKRDDCPACGEEVAVTIERAPDEAESLITVCDDCGGEVARWRRGADGENERVK
ncbi:cupin domain-containing protein [Halobaculum sp. CBA1158]|uniref:cupin domain-containing protein n=1 Tax=Halobaculum sp. CBA1158 TaxID=2904243 RepID=UPI001F3E3CB5|nr:cupin domain-containing protein [Halobaculum sp. CBA1158]UIP00399.1 cupin domain-containing protein [Halobaculum sp. CBA1158]